MPQGALEKGTLKGRPVPQRGEGIRREQSSCSCGVHQSRDQTQPQSIYAVRISLTKLTLVDVRLEFGGNGVGVFHVAVLSVGEEHFPGSVGVAEQNAGPFVRGEEVHGCAFKG